jgi:hypothetical protein
MAVSTLKGEDLGSESRIFDLSLEPSFLEDAGGRWLVGCTQHGHLALWDTATLSQIACHRAATGSIFSCCVMPG